MRFPSLELIKALQENLNTDSQFDKATKWSDVKVLLSFGKKRYWVKLYGGKIIDVKDYSPIAVPLGWDFVISAPLDTWADLIAGRKGLGELINFGGIAVDGNMLQANRMQEAIWMICAAIRRIAINATLKEQE